MTLSSETLVRFATIDIVIKLPITPHGMDHGWSIDI